MGTRGMRFLRYLPFIFLLLSGGVRAASTFASLDSIRVAVHRQLDLPDAGDSERPIERTITAINRAAIRVSKDFPSVPKLDTVFVTIDSTGNGLNADFQTISGVMRINSKDMWMPLIPLPVDSLRTPAENTADDKNATSPIHFFVHANRIFESPKYVGIQGSVDTLQIEYFGLANKLTSGSDTTLVLEQYREGIIVYAAFIISEDPKYFEWYRQLVALERGGQ